MGGKKKIPFLPVLLMVSNAVSINVRALSAQALSLAHALTQTKLNIFCAWLKDLALLTTAYSTNTSTQSHYVQTPWCSYRRVAKPLIPLLGRSQLLLKPGAAALGPQSAGGMSLRSQIMGRRIGVLVKLTLVKVRPVREEVSQGNPLLLLRWNLRVW